MISHVYIITHVPTMRYYIGKANNPYKRWDDHVATSRRKNRTKPVSYLHKAIQKHGLDEFEFEVIESLHTEELALHQERLWIEFFRSTEKGIGFNITAGGAGAIGYRHTDDAKAKIGAASVGNKHNLGRVASEETRKKLSACRIGAPLHPGWKHTDEAKLKIASASASQGEESKSKRKTSMASWRNRSSKCKKDSSRNCFCSDADMPVHGNKGKKRTAESRKKMSEAAFMSKRSRLTENDVRSIRAMRDDGHSYVSIGSRFDISSMYASQIARRIHLSNIK